MNNIYNAGECLPLLLPYGCLWQEDPASETKDEKAVPQYLHSYFDFSLPS